MHNLKLWTPSNKKNNLNKFTNSIKNNHTFKTYHDLHKWSIENKSQFWKQIWKFTKIKGELKGYIYKSNKNFIKSKFFTDSKLNYTQNCLSKNDDTEAIIFYSENNIRKSISWKNLRFWEVETLKALFFPRRKTPTRRSNSENGYDSAAASERAISTNFQSFINHWPLPKR